MAAKELDDQKISRQALPFMMIVSGRAVIHDAQTGAPLPDNWTGFCTDASSVSTIWHIGLDGGERSFNLMRSKNLADAKLELELQDRIMSMEELISDTLAGGTGYKNHLTYVDGFRLSPEEFVTQMREAVQKEREALNKMTSGAGLEIDPVTSEGYKRVMQSTALQEHYQDRLDAFFQERIAAVRNALRQLGWTGKRHLHNPDETRVVTIRPTQVGAGAVVGATYQLRRRSDDPTQRVPYHITPDDLTMTPAELAAHIDLAAHFDHDIKVEDRPDQYAYFLTDRWGDWSSARIEDQVVRTLLHDLEGKYGDARGENGEWSGWADGDPRRLLGDNETSFLVVRDGKFGVLTEIEFSESLAAYEFLDTVGLSDKDFAQQVIDLQKQLRAIKEACPWAEVFIAHGNAGTYDGRICACAFAPIEVSDGLRCVSTSPTPDGIAKLDVLMNEVLLGVSRADTAAPAGQRG